MYKSSFLEIGEKRRTESARRKFEEIAFKGSISMASASSSYNFSKRVSSTSPLGIHERAEIFLSKGERDMGGHETDTNYKRNDRTKLIELS